MSAYIMLTWSVFLEAVMAVLYYMYVISIPFWCLFVIIFSYQKQKEKYESRLKKEPIGISAEENELAGKREEIEVLERRIDMIKDSIVGLKWYSTNVEGTWGDSSSAGKQYYAKRMELAKNYQDQVDLLKVEVGELERRVS